LLEPLVRSVSRQRRHRSTRGDGLAMGGGGLVHAPQSDKRIDTEELPRARVWREGAAQRQLGQRLLPSLTFQELDTVVEPSRGLRDRPGVVGCVAPAFDACESAQQRRDFTNNRGI